jgi:hypothetical protein
VFTAIIAIKVRNFMRGDRSKRLTVLSESEKLALYGLPDFDEFQRSEFFAMTEAE